MFIDNSGLIYSLHETYMLIPIDVFTY